MQIIGWQPPGEHSWADCTSAVARAFFDFLAMRWLRGFDPGVGNYYQPARAI